MSRRRLRQKQVWVGQRCHYCPAPATSIDHIVPQTKSGASALWNYVPACLACQRRKANRMPTCICPRCLWAVVRWQRGERGLSKAIVRRRRRARDRLRIQEELEAEKYPGLAKISEMTREEWIRYETAYWEERS